MNRIGAKMKSLRIAKGLTEKQLAKSLGVTEQFIIDAESGRRLLNDDLVNRAARILGQALLEVSVFEESVPRENESLMSGRKYQPGRRKDEPASAGRIGTSSVGRAGTSPAAPVQEVWAEALDSILKSVPVYQNDLKTPRGHRIMTVISGKVEGYNKDKVFYLEIMDDDMTGFRISKGDAAFSLFTGEAANNGIFLVEYGGERKIRQLKKLDSSKCLLISHKDRIKADTVPLSEVKILARLLRLEVNLA